MRLMITYRNTAGRVAVADVHTDATDVEGLDLQAIPDDAVTVYSAVEVMDGLDYDKAGLARQAINPTAPALMLLK